jgi:hypothetical protein
VLHDPAVPLAGIGERLPLPELQLQQPLAGSSLSQTGRLPLAVMKNVSRLMDDEVFDAASLRKVFRGDVAGGLLAGAVRLERT